MHRPARTAGLALALVLAPIHALADAQTWQPAPSFPDASSARSHAVGIAAGADLFCFGGRPGDAVGDGPSHWLPAGAAAWTTLDPVGDVILGQGAGIDDLGRIVVFGGVRDGTLEREIAWIFDPDAGGLKDDIADRTPAAADQQFAWATDDLGRVYSISGRFVAGSAMTPWVERYVGTQDAWEAVAPLPRALIDAAATNDGLGHLLVIGGYESGATTPTANVWRYDVATDAWSETAVPDCPQRIAGARALLAADGCVWLVGGELGGQATRAVWLYEPLAQEWRPGPALATARRHHALATTADGSIWAMGGPDASVERLVLVPTPSIFQEPADRTTYETLDAHFEVGALGDAPLAYTWRRDGVALADGPSIGGGTIVGAWTRSLAIRGAGLADGGDYDVVVSNGAGTATSRAARLVVRPAPTGDVGWSVVLLHRDGVLSSSAAAVDAGHVVGHETLDDGAGGTRSGPTEWSAFGSEGVAYDNGGDLDAGFLDVRGDLAVGWFWWPYWTPYGTGYEKHAAIWERSTGELHHVQPSGMEVGAVAATDGVQHVGSITPDPDGGQFDPRPMLWNSISTGAISLLPAGMRGGTASAVDGGRQFGQVHLSFGTLHAAMWSGSAASFVDLNPSTASASGVAAARDGCVVGSATIGGVVHAWQFDPDDGGDGVDLHPAGATSSSLAGTALGLHVGTVDGRATLWVGATTVDLHGLLDPRYTLSSARDLEIGAAGEITVVGSATDPALPRTEPVVWLLGHPDLLADRDRISATDGATVEWTLHAGAPLAGATYWVLGSVTGTSPGLVFKRTITLPLVYDAWFELTLVAANSDVLVNTLAPLDAWGNGRASLVVGPGELELDDTLTAWHAYVVFAPGHGVTYASRAVELLVDP